MSRRHVAAFTVVLAAVAVLAAAAPAAAGTPGVNARQARQEARIEHARADGRLTACEAARLDARGDRLARREAHYRATGLGVGPVERADLHRRLDARSAAIARQAHDDDRCF